jgi:hypothetical protein
VLWTAACMLRGALGGAGRLEALHRALSSSHYLMRVFGQINIEMTSVRKLGRVKPPGNNMCILPFLIAERGWRKGIARWMRSPCTQRIARRHSHSLAFCYPTPIPAIKDYWHDEDCENQTVDDWAGPGLCPDRAAIARQALECGMHWSCV